MIVGLSNFNLKKVDEVIKMYSNKESQEFFTAILGYFNFNKNQYKYFVRFNFKEISLDIFIKFLLDVEIMNNNEKIVFKKGEEIKIGRSEKNNLEKMEKNKKKVKLNVISTSLSSDNNYIQLLYER